MNSNGLALIVGALVIAVAALVYFNTDLFRSRGGGDHDINVTIETPAAPAPAPAY